MNQRRTQVTATSNDRPPNPATDSSAALVPLADGSGSPTFLLGLRWVFLMLAVVAIVLLVVPEEAEATHYRYATLSWEPGDEANEVVFTGQFAARWTFFEDDQGAHPELGDVLEMGPLDRGDGNSAPLHIRVDFIDEDDDWLMGPITEANGDPGVSHTYGNPTRPDGSPWKAVYDHCCRLEETDDENINFHVNNGDPGTDIRLETLVDLSAPQNSSPITTLDPIQFCPLEAVCTIPVPVTDPDEDTLSFRMATSQEAVGGGEEFIQPGPPDADHAATIDAETGVITWNTTGATFDPSFEFTLYSIQVMIEDGATKVPLDFFIRLTPEPNVTLEKSTQDVFAGEDASFQIVATNDGASNAFNVRISDTLPVGFDWTHDQDSRCTIDQGTLECLLETLGPGESFSVTITAPTTRDQCGDVFNEATATTANQANESVDSATLRVLCPNLELTKSGQGASAGENVSFTLLVENVGSDTVTDVTLSDPLPGALDWEVVLAESHDSCAIEADLLECGPAELGPGTSLSVRVTAATTFGDCGLLDNEATVDAPNHPVLSDTASVTIDCPLLELEKSSTQEQVTAGENMTFTITLTNTGDGTALDAGFTDPLPDGMTWDLLDGDASCTLDDDGDLLNCGPVDLPTGGSLVAQVTAETAFADCGSLTNTAFASAANHPQTTDSAQVTIECPALELTKTADPSPVDAGEHLTFTITLTNTGDGTALDVGFTDPLPDGMEWELVDDDAPCALTADGNLLDCGPVDLPTGESLVAQVTAETAFADCGSLTNTATAGAGNHPALDDSVSVTIRCPQLELEKTAEGDPIQVGENATFTITLTNTGSATAKEAGFTDLLPGALSWELVASQSHPSCTLDGNLLTCGNVDLDTSETLTATVTATTDESACGLMENQAVATSSNHPDVTASAGLVVECVELLLEKNAREDPFLAGGEVAFTIRVTNTGQTSAQGVQITDPLPPGFDWTHDRPGPCTIADGTLECLIGQLPPGDAFTVQVSAPVPPDGCRTITNEVLVEAENHEPLTQSAQARCLSAQALAQFLYAGVTTPESVEYATHGAQRETLGEEHEEVVTVDTQALLGGNSLPRIETYDLTERANISRSDDNLTAHAITTASETRLLDGTIVIGALHNEALLRHDPETGTRTLETDHYLAHLEILGEAITLDGAPMELDLPGGGHLKLFTNETVEGDNETFYRSRIAHLLLPVRLDPDTSTLPEALQTYVTANVTTVEIIIGEVQVRISNESGPLGQHREILEDDDAGSDRDATTDAPVHLRSGVYEGSMPDGDERDVYTVDAETGDLLAVVLEPAVRVAARGGAVMVGEDIDMELPQTSIDRRDYRVRVFDPDGTILTAAESQHGAIPAVILLDATTDGRHRIVVDSPTSSPAANYTLVVVVIPELSSVLPTSGEPLPEDPSIPGVPLLNTVALALVARAPSAARLTSRQRGRTATLEHPLEELPFTK